MENGAMTPTRSALLGIVLILTSCSNAATTITVNPGGNIQSAINQVAPGGTVLVKAGEYTGGLTLNKSVTVVGEGKVTVRPAAAGTGSAVNVQCSECGVDNIDFVDFRYGFGTLEVSGRNDVFLTNSAIVNANYHVWISGDRWKVIGNRFEKAKWRAEGNDGDSDYGRIFGNGHEVRRNVFGDTDILTNKNETDGKPGPDFSHTDGLQYYNQDGQVLRDVVIEENLFTDFVQGLFIGNETGNGDAVQRVTVRNNVFWGTRFRARGNLLGMPSWGVYFGKNGPERKITIEHNIFYQCTNVFGILNGTDAICRRNIVASGGTVYVLEGMDPSLITRTPGGNALWKNSRTGDLPLAGDIDTENPKFQDPLAETLDELLGADGKWMTADDACRPMNPALNDYGPRVPAWQGN